MNCALCGKEIKPGFGQFQYMNREGTIIVDNKNHGYKPNVKLIYYDGKMERLPVHWECRLHMRRWGYVKEKYGYEDLAQ